MEAKDVRNLKWQPLTGWENITTSHLARRFKIGPTFRWFKSIDPPYWENPHGKFELRVGPIVYFVTETDVDCFVDNAIMDLARDLHIPYPELKKIVFEENQPFFKAKESVFATNKYREKQCFSRNDRALTTLEQMFRLPVAEIN